MVDEDVLANLWKIRDLDRHVTETKIDALWKSQVSQTLLIIVLLCVVLLTIWSLANHSAKIQSGKERLWDLEHKVHALEAAEKERSKP